MGESSKKIGEIGENIVDKFFNLIGWCDPLANQPISCLKPKKHALKGSKKGHRSEHGIDYLLSFKSSLESNTIESIVVSVKNSDAPYPNNPSTIFKKHIEDLAYTLECYNRSSVKAEQLQGFQGANRQKDTGVIFWLSSSNETADEVISKLANVRVDPDLKFDAIHLVDNRQIEFIFDVINFARSTFSDKNILFHYPETSLNYADKSISRYGTSLPVEFISSPVIPMMLEDKGKELATFCLATLERFDENSMAQLIQAAREYTNEVKCKYVFLFPNYVKSQHSDSVIKAKKHFDQKISSQITVMSYKPDFRSLNND